MQTPKILFTLLTSSLCYLFLATTSCFAGAVSVESGKQLFNNHELGGSKTDKSCNSCHDSGNGLEMSLNNTNLEKQINRCVVGALQGEALIVDSDEMQSVKKYLISLGQ